MILLSRNTKAIIFSFLDCFFLKQESKVILVVKNRTEYSGNLRIATDILVKNNQLNVYVYKDGKILPKIKRELNAQGVTVLEKWSIFSLYHLLTAGIFILSHAPRDAHITKRCNKRKVINLWHGVVFKTIENLMPNIPKKKNKQIKTNANLYDMIISSSDSDKKMMIRAFMVPESKVRVTGLPRYEILKKTYKLDNFLQMQKNKLLAYKKEKKLILYAPTFREKNISALKQMKTEDWDILATLLENTNSIMAIRPHAYDLAIPKYIQNNKSFCWLPHDEFTETNLVLQNTDILIADFSSIWIDYLLLKRPIVGFAKDFDYYQKYERGFVYDFEEVFPDEFFHTTEKLVLYLEKILVKNVNSFDYEKSMGYFHNYNLSTNFLSKLSDVLEFKD